MSYGLNAKGRRDYPKFTKEDIEVKECEICENIQTVKQYEITTKKRKKRKIYLCDDCTTRKPKGVQLTLIDKKVDKFVPIKKEEEEEVVVDDDLEEGDSLLI